MTKQILAKICDDVKFNVSPAGMSAVIQLLEALKSTIKSDNVAYNNVQEAIRQLEVK